MLYDSLLRVTCLRLPHSSTSSAVSAASCRVALSISFFSTHHPPAAPPPLCFCWSRSLCCSRRRISACFSSFAVYCGISFSSFTPLSAFDFFAFFAFFSCAFCFFFSSSSYTEHNHIRLPSASRFSPSPPCPSASFPPTSHRSTQEDHFESLLHLYCLLAHLLAHLRSLFAGSAPNDHSRPKTRRCVPAVLSPAHLRLDVSLVILCFHRNPPNLVMDQNKNRRFSRLLLPLRTVFPVFLAFSSFLRANSFLPTSQALRLSET